MLATTFRSSAKDDGGTHGCHDGRHLRAQVVKPTVDFREAYSLRFVNKGVGLEIRPKN